MGKKINETVKVSTCPLTVVVTVVTRVIRGIERIIYDVECEIL